ncbi:hypothetical protein MNBD_GAMMA11-3339 [hydrothermal vent metagenome]|uniref:Uncharacterized protein n=1 Tax=hydrothermal vent metagenome TaxID=652676 RepID=A0A3B0XQM5_9ZZZZ
MPKTPIKIFACITSLLATNTLMATEHPAQQLNIENINRAYTQCISNIVDSHSLSCTNASNCAGKRIAIHFKNVDINLSCLKQHGGPVIVYSYEKRKKKGNRLQAEQIAAK